jgi:hypothetical protein
MADGHGCGLTELAVRTFVTSLRFP